MPRPGQDHIVEPHRGRPGFATPTLRAALFAELARRWQAADSPHDVCRRICADAIRVLPAVQHASITTITNGAAATVGFSDEVALSLDECQRDAQQGPGLNAVADRAIVWSGDLRTDGRWPALAARIARDGVARSVIAFPISSLDAQAGAVTLSAAGVHAFSGIDRAIAATFATHAGIAVTAAGDRARADHLTAALLSSRTIGVAVGIVMAREVLSEHAAFTRLQLVSQQTNRKLRDIAADVVFTGELPTPPLRLAANDRTHRDDRE